jgi:hypothetical protein
MSRIDQMRMKRTKNVEEKQKIKALWEPRRIVDGFGYGSVPPKVNNPIIGVDEDVQMFDNNDIQPITPDDEKR